MLIYIECMTIANAAKGYTVYFVNDMIFVLLQPTENKTKAGSGNVRRQASFSFLDPDICLRITFRYTKVSPSALELHFWLEKVIFTRLGQKQNSVSGLFLLNKSKMYSNQSDTIAVTYRCVHRYDATQRPTRLSILLLFTCWSLNAIFFFIYTCLVLWVCL